MKLAEYPSSVSTSCSDKHSPEGCQQLSRKSSFVFGVAFGIPVPRAVTTDAPYFPLIHSVFFITYSRQKQRGWTDVNNSRARVLLCVKSVAFEAHVLRDITVDVPYLPLILAFLAFLLITTLSKRIGCPATPVYLS
ncbi:hypothetical protein BaRGS_00016756 [Batillaria attramentaria]|uniref:Uncharacterized protein n=1 Tax=Batillaria attramentaria TaxID=370345 RepID=A0ABD0KXY5_9CAEN